MAEVQPRFFSQMGPAAALNHIIAALFILLALLQPANAEQTSEHNGGTGMSNGIPSSTDTDGGDQDPDGGSGPSYSSLSNIGQQPVRIQLSAGFIVGCVIGVFIYMGVRTVRRIRRRHAARTRRQMRAGPRNDQNAPGLAIV